MSRKDERTSPLGALEVEYLYKGYGPNQVLRGVDLRVEPGSLSAVLGLSGCGKTTLLRVIAGFERVQSGRVRLSGLTLDDGHAYVPPERRGIGYVPQEGALFPHLDVRANVAFGLPRVRRRGQRRGRRGGKEVTELLEMVGLTALARRMPHELSGGEQQRVALARALAREPALLLLDEPFSSLDATMRVSVREEVGALLREHGTTTVLVTHDQEEALSLADTVAVLRDGKIVQQASPTEIYAAPADAALASFLGEANLIEASFEGATAHTPLGALELHAAGAGAPMIDHGGPMDSRRVPSPSGDEPAEGGKDLGERGVVVVRPEQLRVNVDEPGGHEHHGDEHHGDEHDGDEHHGHAGARVRARACACAGLHGTVEQSRYYGHDALLSIRPDDPRAAPLLLARVHGDCALPAGTRVFVTATGIVTGLEAPARTRGRLGGD